MTEISHKKENIIFKIFNPPKTNFEDYYDQARYILSFKICLFLTFSLGLLTIILFSFYGEIYSRITFVGFIGVLTAYILIKRTKDHRKFVLSFNIFGALLCQLSIYYIKDQPHISDGLWMIINIIFAFNTINKKWAAIITIIHTLSFTLFFYFFYNDQLHLIRDLNQQQITATSINVLICFFIIFYLCWQNIKTNNFAQKQLRKANESLQSQYDIINKQNIEKTVLLKEIHHRVKNNLQVIISLLRLQSRELENEEAISKFKDTTGRVLTMSLIHEKMYQSEELSKINLNEYFNSLIIDILDSYDINFKVERKINCQIENLDMRSIVPIALIFNELFSNSLKHAFKNIEIATISLDFIQLNDTTFRLEYFDNGNWVEPLKKDTFGVELISVLVDQIDGELKFTNSPSTHYSIQFENEKTV